jgi:hypothetical protein
MEEESIRLPEMQIGEVLPVGLERTGEYSNIGKASKCAAPCAALGSEFRQTDQELAIVIDAWPSLPGSDRAHILAIARAIGGA